MTADDAKSATRGRVHFHELLDGTLVHSASQDANIALTHLTYLCLQLEELLVERIHFVLRVPMIRARAAIAVIVDSTVAASTHAFNTKK